MLFVSRVTVDPDGPRRRTRRGALRALGASVVALAVVPVATAVWPRRPGRSEEPNFDETYRGHRIRGTRTDSDHTAYLGARKHTPGDWYVTVDGRPLHLMRRADGTYLSMIDHYRSYPTALAATRAAVDELGTTQRLKPPEHFAEGQPGRGTGETGDVRGTGGHGVHA
ncbi:tyrosinase family oxidase copper chaperone [Streptomyces sp. NPDC002643]